MFPDDNSCAMAARNTNQPRIDESQREVGMLTAIVESALAILRRALGDQTIRPSTFDGRYAELPAACSELAQQVAIERERLRAHRDEMRGRFEQISDDAKSIYGAQRDEARADAAFWREATAALVLRHGTAALDDEMREQVEARLKAEGE